MYLDDVRIVPLSVSQSLTRDELLEGRARERDQRSEQFRFVVHDPQVLHEDGQRRLHLPPVPVLHARVDNSRIEGNSNNII